MQAAAHRASRAGSARTSQKIALKRAYEPATADDGFRVLVDRLWPRGRSRSALALDEWAKDLAPTPGLRQWFGHHPVRWKGFHARYRRELSSQVQRERLHALLAAAGTRRLTLVYGARDPEHNHAQVLRAALLRAGRSR